VGLVNRLCIAQLRRAKVIVQKRIDLAESAADAGFAQQALHAEKMRQRLADIDQRISERERAESLS